MAAAWQVGFQEGRAGGQLAGQLAAPCWGPGAWLGAQQAPGPNQPQRASPAARTLVHAGLAAVGTAKSLGAVVRVFDTRAAVAEQVRRA